MMTEESTGGDASWQLYRSYSKYNGGNWFIFALLIAMFGWMMFNAASNIWISVWTEHADESRSDSYYLNYYIIIGVFYAFFAFIRALILAFASPKMSAFIHESMITNLLFSPLNEFFDRVPLGRILNRLSKDLNSVDANLSVFLSNALAFIFFLLTSLIIIMYCSSIWIFVPIIAYLLGCYFLKNYYMKPNR
jgi:ATP-binding cassette subfamily C (CFTR/MRP) protein 1